MNNENLINTLQDELRTDNLREYLLQHKKESINKISNLLSREIKAPNENILGYGCALFTISSVLGRIGDSMIINEDPNSTITGIASWVAFISSMIPYVVYFAKNKKYTNELITESENIYNSLIN